MVRRNSAQQERNRRYARKGHPACHICGRAIDYTIPYRNADGTVNPEAFVADHVRALAKGGAHTTANVKAAHAGCNNKKRARDVAPIVRRSGSLK